MSDHRTPTTPRSSRAATQAIGRAWRVFGLLIFLLGTRIPQYFLVIGLEEAGYRSRMAEAILVHPLFLLGCLIAGGYFAIRGRQLRSRACAEAVIADSRPPVVYLRTFRSERSTIRTLLIGTFFPTWFFEIFYNEEEQLAEAVSNIGPFVALGKLGESLPKLGATRVYVRDEVWQDAIRDRLQQASLVIVRAGEGENLWWEIEQSFRTVQPTQLLILILRMPRKTYNAFVDRIESDFGITLPRVAERLGRISGLLTFDSDWQPVTLDLKAPNLRVTVSKPLRALYSYSLRPVYANLGINWIAPPVSAAKLIFIAAVLLIATLTYVSF